MIAVAAAEVGEPGSGARRDAERPAGDVEPVRDAGPVATLARVAARRAERRAVLAGALSRLGVEQFTGVRIVKRFELTVEGEVGDDTLATARRIADEILSNSVIEDVVGIEVVE